MKRHFFSNNYNKFERTAGWLLFIAGFLILTIMGLVDGAKEMASDQSMPLSMKVSILSLIIGAVIVLISVFRERFFKEKQERYKEIDI